MKAILGGKEINAAIMALFRDAVPLKEIVRRTDIAANSFARSAAAARARISSGLCKAR